MLLSPHWVVNCQYMRSNGQGTVVFIWAMWAEAEVGGVSFHCLCMICSCRVHADHEQLEIIWNLECKYPDVESFTLCPKSWNSLESLRLGCLELCFFAGEVI